MNIDVLIKWVQDILAFLEKESGKAGSTYDPEKLQEKLGWVLSFRQSIHDWVEILRVTGTIEYFVRTQGLYIDAIPDLEKVLGNVSKNGFTDLLLSIGAMVSSISGETILAALAFASTQKVLAWKQKMLGSTLQSQRRKELDAHRKAEQKLYQSFSQW